jgi:hypothetical protein
VLAIAQAIKAPMQFIVNTMEYNYLTSGSRDGVRWDLLATDNCKSSDDGLKKALDGQANKSIT